MKKVYTVIAFIAFALISIAQPLTRVSMGSSTNIFSVIVTESNCLTANQDLNSIMFTKRRNTSTAGASGIVENAVSTNGGTSFDSTLVVVPDDVVHFCRYPSGTFVNNTPGNTNIANAFAVAAGPWHPGQSWQGNYFGSIKLSGANNNVNYIDNLNLLGAQKSDFARYSIQSCDNGKVYVLGGYYDDVNGTTALAQGYRYAVLHIGTLNTGTNSFSWSTKTFPHPFRIDAVSGTKNVITTPICAFSQDGNVGYVIYIGQDSVNYNQNKSYQPIIYKTTNAGVTWTEMPYYSFAKLAHLLPYLRSTNAGSKRPFFNTQNGFDATVDATNNLHIFCNISPCSSNDPDSLDYTWSNQNLLCDIYSTSNGWDAIVLDSLKTTQVLATNSPWQASDASGGNVSGARLQVSRTQNGQKIFYGWADTDYNLAPDTSWFSDIGINLHSDIFVKGLDVATKLLTPTTNVTANDAVLHGNCDWMYFSNITLKNGSTYKLPLSRTYSRNGTFDAIAAVQHEFISGAQLTDAQFTIAPHAICANFTPNVNVNNNIATATLPGNSNTPFVYSWDNDFYEGANSKTLANGNHTVSIVNSIGCAYSTNFNVSSSVASVPFAINDNASTTTNTPVLINVLANDYDTASVINPLTLDLNIGLAGIQSSFSNAIGSWLADTSGNVTYTPATGYVGNAVKTYSVQNSGGSVSNIATITVSVVNPSNTLASNYLDTNKIKARFENNFQFFWDSQAGSAQFEVPKGSGKHAHFASALWLSGIDAGGQLHAAAQTYSQTGVDYQYGPVAASRTANNYETRYNRLWKINKAQIQYHIANYTDTAYNMPEVILNWPANGNTSNGEAAQLAPFYDANSNGVYEPQNGDYPQIKGDQCIYMIFNDDKIHTETSDSNPLKFDIHVMAYEVAGETNAIDTTIFLQYKIVNRSTNTYHGLRMGIWNDFDLGNYLDDIPGTDVGKNMAFMYNATNNDNVYGANPPAIGSIFLNKTMKKCIFFQNNSSTVTGNPSNGTHINNYLNGLWLNGSPLTYGGNGTGGATNCSYFAPWTTDNANPTNWELTTAADYRTLQSTDSIILAPNASSILETAFLFQRSNLSNMQSAYDLKSRAALVQNYYNTNLNSDTALSVTITSTNTNICAGQSITFTATAVNAGTGFTFQWFKNGQPIVGANSATYSSTSLANGDSIYCYVVTSLSQTAQSNSITVTVNTSVAPTINITASQTTICSGTTVFLNATVTNGGTSPTYQWFKNGNVLAGFTSDTISSNSFANNDIITCVLTSNAECASPNVVTSNSISFVVNASPNLAVNPVAAAVCAGSPSTTLTASGATTYSWSPATGLNSTTTAQVIASPTLSTTYTVTGTSNGCIATAQAVVTYTNSGTASLTIAATQTSICTGNNVIFTAIPSYGGNAPTYQWKKNGVNIAGAIAYIYSSSSLQNNDVITCTMVSNDPCVTTTNATSNSITMTVNASSTPTVSILSSGSTICAGSNVTFTATPAFGGNAPTYVWKINGVIASTSGATFNSNSLNNNDTVRCYMTSNAVCAIPATVNSNAVIMSVSPLLTPTIDITASQNNICSGTSVTFTASITNGGAAPTYQWQKNNINISGATSATYSSSTLGNNDAITCILTSNATCANPISVASNSISMVVTQSGVASVLAASSTGSIICANASNSVIFIATPTNGGSSPTYQWYLNGAAVTGQTSNLYLPPLINNNDSVRCVMTSNSSCVPQTVVSSPLVVMTVLPNVTASVSITSTATNICKGTRVIFTATAGAGITNPLYQWRINGINIPQETGSTFNSTTLNNGDDVSALLFSATECLSSNNVASNNITMSVNQSNFGLGFTANTQTPSASSQFNVQFTNNTTITANKNFIWYYGDGTNYTGLIPQDHYYPSNGVYSVALKVVDTQTGCADSLSKSNYITCVGSNNNCNQTITLTPTTNSIAGCQGGSVLLSCATNASNPTYQWNKNGIPMGGETQSSYNATSQGNYTVTVYNNGGCPVTSNGKQITFNSPSSPAPVITQTGVFQSCIQNSVTLTVNSGYSSYLWSTGDTSQSITVGQSGLYSVMGTNTIGCNRQSNPMAVNNSSVAAPEICMVFVDSVLNKNVIVWEKPVTTEIDSFIVFKETSQQSVYQRVGGQPYAALSEFIDITSNPSQQADVYKLAIKDNCGNLTLPSFYHRTIYLQITPNIGTSRVLSWNNNLGYIAQNYIINRGQIGSMHPIDTIAGTENTYTDYPPSTTPNDTVYRIDIVYSAPCTPSLVQMQNDFQALAQRVRSTSNTGGNLTVLNIGNSTLERSLFEVNLKLFPNPNNGNFVLQNADGSMLEKGQVEVFDLAGRKVIETTIQSDGIIQMDGVSNGVYYVKYSTAKSSKTLKMMVQK